MLSVPETNLTSSFPSDQLENPLHLLLSPVPLQQASPMQLVFERIYSPLDFALSVVRPALFVVLHHQGPSLQYSPLSQVTGCRTSRHHFSKFIHIFGDKIGKLLLVNLSCI